METYIIKRGDTLESIASMYNIPASEIIKANGLIAPYYLTEGSTLSIPIGIFNIFDYYTVQNGDTLYKIATQYGTTVETLAAINGLNINEYIYPNQTLLIPKRTVGTYITTNGDTMNTVARHFNVTPLDILRSNNNIYLLPEQLIIYRKIWFF